MAKTTSTRVADPAHEDGADRLIDSLAGAEQAALDAVRKFLEAVNGAFPHTGTDGRSRQKIIDSAFKMTEELVGTSNEFAHRLVKLGGTTARRAPRRTRSVKRVTARHSTARNGKASKSAASYAPAAKADAKRAPATKTSTTRAPAKRAPAAKAAAHKAPAKRSPATAGKTR